MAKIQSVEPNIADLANGWMKTYGLNYKLEQESLNSEIDQALNDYYSKNGGAGGNRPDAKLLLRGNDIVDYPILIEYKGYEGKLVKTNVDGKVTNKNSKNLPDFKAINSYAVNGAVHYANALLHYTSYTYSITSVIEYSFTKPLVLEDAVMKISVARSLFSFFGNGYIPFGDITFEDDVEKTKYVLYLNYKENIPVVDEPFLITTSMFSGQFQNVWELWLNLYESANPIPRLFYEIICNRSTGINSYLNLSQAIEVYSNTYRNIEANAIAKSDKNNKSKGKNTKLKHRYQDILYTYNSVLKLDEADIENYAHGFSNIRNYYTHYNHGTYVEPSYDELLSAIHILRFILLTIVYTSVGISVDNILECRKIAFFRELDIDASKILKYSKKKRCSFNGNNIEETAKR